MLKFDFTNKINHMENILKEFRAYVKKTADALTPIQDQSMGQIDRMEKYLSSYTKNLVEFADLITDKINALVLDNPVADAFRDALVRERELALSDFQSKYRPQ